MTAFSIKIDVRQAAETAERVERVSGRSLSRVAVAAVNDVTTRFDDKSRERITERVNLSPVYVKSKTTLTLAKDENDPRAEIVVGGALTIIGRYGPVEYRQAGAPRRGGAVRGSRSAGVGVEVRRGSPVFEPQWFLMRLRVGAEPGQNIGAFVRTSASKKPKHLYGPSPYSLFRQQVEYHQAELSDDLERTALAGLVNEIEVGLK